MYCIVLTVHIFSIYNAGETTNEILIPSPYKNTTGSIVISLNSLAIPTDALFLGPLPKLRLGSTFVSLGFIVLTVFSLQVQCFFFRPVDGTRLAVCELWLHVLKMVNCVKNYP